MNADTNRLRGILTKSTEDLDKMDTARYLLEAPAPHIVGFLIERIRELSAPLPALLDELDATKARAVKAEAERDHWKANHDNQVAIKAAILQRPDLKERAYLVMRLVQERDALREVVRIATELEANYNGEDRSYDLTLRQESLMGDLKEALAKLKEAQG